MRPRKCFDAPERDVRFPKLELPIQQEFRDVRQSPPLLTNKSASKSLATAPKKLRPQLPHSTYLDKHVTRQRINLDLRLPQAHRLHQIPP